MSQNYKIKHIGINSTDEQQAREQVALLCDIFDLKVTEEGKVGIFVGTIFEVMKHNRRGAHGHIALQPEDVEEAMKELAAKGITFQEDTIRRDANGKIEFVYLQQEFFGFQVHLTT